MITKKSLIAIILTTLFLSSFISMIGSTRSVSNVVYDPWCDLNDDGHVDIFDAIIFSMAFGGEGTPLNKTELLYNVNATYASLLSRIDYLNATIAALDSRISALEAYYPVASAIPFQMVYNDTYDTTHEQWPNWVDMGGMSVTVNLSRSSQILILWTGELQNLGDNRQDPSEDSQTYVRALVNNTAVPLNGYATPSIDPTGAFGLVNHSHYVRWGGYTFTFCSSPLDAGFYTIKVEWTCHLGMGEVQQRQLTVIALPA